MYECKWHVIASKLDPFNKPSLWRVEFTISILSGSPESVTHFFKEETTLFSIDVNSCWSEEQAISEAFKLLDQKHIISNEL